MIFDWVILLSALPGIFIQQVVFFVIFFTLPAKNTPAGGAIEKCASKSPDPVNAK